MTTPVCSTCNDTHKMTLSSDGEVDRVVMCTRCPVPCQDCRAGGNGAFCTATPCACGCHKPPGSCEYCRRRSKSGEGPCAQMPCSCSCHPKPCGFGVALEAGR